MTSRGRGRRPVKRAMDRYAERVGAELHEEIVGDPDAAIRSGASTAVAIALAVLVDLGTAALVVLGVVLVVVVPFRVGGLVLCAILLIIAWDVRPKLRRLPDEHAADLVEGAPALHGYLREIAAAVGTRPVDLVYVTPGLNAAVYDAGLRRRRVLLIGAPLWVALTPGQRTAVLGHELGHFVNGDSRRSVVVGGALTTLSSWYGLLQDPRTVGFSGSRSGLVRGGGESGLVAVGTWITRWTLRILGVLPWAAYWVLLAVTLRSSQRGEYRADRVSAVVAGTADVEGALRLASRSDEIVLELRRATMARDPDLLLVASFFAGSEGSAGRRARTRSLLDSHPPMDLRLDAVGHLPALEPTVEVAAERSREIDLELAPALAAAERRLRDSFRR